jgi:hypothetical protein
MCTGMEVLLLASTAVSVGTAIHQGEQQQDWNNYEANQATADATAERGAAAVQADKIRKMARLQAGEANAALSASGVSTGEGTALLINEDIYANAEQDAVMTIFGGNDRANRGNADAAGYRLKGSQAKTAGYLNATSSLLAGA